MTPFVYRVAGILPAALAADGDLVAAVMGWQDAGASTYVVPLSADGLEPATHYGFSSLCTENFRAMVEAQTLPAGVPWQAVGLTEARALAVLTGLVYAIGANTTDAAAQFAGLIEAQGLARIPAMP